ncbi:hypothetical protein D6853_09520 [Butyrivibrio sp. X503]|uniref:hypothetical protein n=1 Tax=Butyrivibrio sp. X503 TaxID=2364878 RepID=UPI000EA9B223|nr:hypothetical protein [Butyrivibrio sp. X503]RKM55774.1 hypothetical protein D6853_09520 [Butyrivibrio sp. X503]
MNENIRRKKQEITNKKIYKKYSDLDCIRILNTKERDDVDKVFINALDEIRRLEYSKSFTTEYFDNPYEYIDYLYENLKLNKRNIKWLIPGFGGGSKWYEVIVIDIKEFFHTYFENEMFSDFSAIDLENRVIFEIESGEEAIEYYLKKYK